MAPSHSTCRSEGGSADTRQAGRVRAVIAVIRLTIALVPARFAVHSLGGSCLSGSGSQAISGYWRPMTFQIISPIPNQPPLRPSLIATSDQLFGVREKMPDEKLGFRLPGEEATFRWQFPLTRQEMTLSEARLLSSQFLAIKTRPTIRSLRGRPTALGAQRLWWVGGQLVFCPASAR